LPDGLFITFEGIEGSGKSTQINLLYEKLKAEGHDPVITREPGGTMIGRKIRDILLDPEHDMMDYRTEILLYAADRAQDVKENIAPALAKGKIVLADRFVDSNLAYQAYGRGLDYDFIRKINSWVIEPYWPEITFILDINLEEGLRRAKAMTADASGDRLEREVITFHQKVRDAYLEMAKEDRFVLINANQSASKIQQKIYNNILGRLS